MNVAEFIVDTGDAAVLLPIAALVFASLWLTGAMRGSLAWVFAIGSCAAVMVVLKLACYVCASSLVVVGLRSPSGHTALATAVYGSLTAMVVPRLDPAGVRTAVVSLVAVWIAGIAASSVAIHAHSVPEVVTGILVGTASVMLFRAQIRRGWPDKSQVAVVAALAVAGLILLHGQRVEAEGPIKDLATLIDESIGSSVSW
jgi:membrane-associated phospholipid phosphatase